MILVKCDRCGDMIPDDKSYYSLELTKEEGDGQSGDKSSFELCQLCRIDFEQWMKMPDRKR